MPSIPIIMPQLGESIAEATVVKQNLLVTCQKCHPDAKPNFPTSWVGHYKPSPTHYPLVYYVNLFYTILIPAVIGGMLSATVLAILFVPLFFALVARRSGPPEVRRDPGDPDADACAEEEEERARLAAAPRGPSPA
jgi:hypothetical protein